MEIRRLKGSDAEILWNFRLIALEAEPAAFVESAEEHRLTPVDVFARRLRDAGSDSFAMGAFADLNLIGMAGFFREHHQKTRHKGHIWGVFVLPAHRGKGVGRALVTEVLRQARSLHGLKIIHLSVALSQRHACNMYLSLGFRSFGVEPAALLHQGEFLEEDHMFLELA